MDLDGFRDLVPITKKFKYLNHAAISPTPLPVLFETFNYLYRVAQLGAIAVNEEESDEFLHIRVRIANLINSSPEEVSLIPNTSFGVNLVAHGIPLEPGDKVVTDSLEFPATVFPFVKLAKKGIKVSVVKTRPESLEEDIIGEIDERTKIVSVSHVSFNTGVKLDVKRIVEKAKKVGAYVLLDVIQSAGALNVDVRELGADFAVAGGYKWLMAPQGSGFIYVRRGLLEDPPFYGWKSTREYLMFDPTIFELEKGPRRFEIGTIDVASNLGLAKSAEILSQHKGEIERRVLELSKIAIEMAEDKGMEVITPKEKRSGIVVVKVKEPRKVAERLLQKNIVVSPRGEGVRISAHFYNTEEEIRDAIYGIASS
ncbi:MAG: class V aminotransferase [Candidatus Aramenus sulfurataquae]|jgi:selenocysteine lyase/cysteine desulfurase|uniref:Aminotransferase class V-fold PLP-dependent enzyme n=2 Tax=Candidatus Aramenus sulfurataquae TaxID=1326980 RepID=W7KMP1_9CREN|nr:MAG: class V aminotransferase [Candidatus Aramenus sulfurataquae]MCL7343729.1 aminotransferase class V-fold PLP-dependent enzyme [Candidatus Aramenus sulfurataquae]